MKLSDASWVWPLLKAVAEGETLQCRHPQYGWADFPNANGLRFENPGKPEDWRIKPKQPEYRLFQYSKRSGYAGTLSVVQRNTDRDTSPYSLRTYEALIREDKGKWVTPWLPLPSGEDNAPLV